MAKRVKPAKVAPPPGCESFPELLAFLGHKHVLAILWALSVKSPRRFSEIEAETGISPRSLSARLVDFERNGLLTRRSYDERPPRVEYTLTPKGRALVPIFETLNEWHHSFGTGPFALVPENTEGPVKGRA